MAAVGVVSVLLVVLAGKSEKVEFCARLSIFLLKCLANPHPEKRPLVSRWRRRRRWTSNKCNGDIHTQNGISTEVTSVVSALEAPDPLREERKNKKGETSVR